MLKNILVLSIAIFFAGNLIAVEISPNNNFIVDREALNSLRIIDLSNNQIYNPGNRLIGLNDLAHYDLTHFQLFNVNQVTEELKEAIRLYLNNNFESARSILMRLLNSNLTQYQKNIVHYLLGEIYFNQGDRINASRHFSSLTNEDEGDQNV